MQEENFKERDCMSFEGFCVCVKYDIQRKLGKDFTVTVEDVTKNNNIMLKGLIIKEQGFNIFPTIYMKNYYNRYMEGEKLEDIENDVLHTYWKNKAEKLFESELLTDWQKASKRITYKLINYERNKAFLQDVPHCQFLDLAVVCEYYLGSNNDMSMSMVIHASLLKLWGISWEELYASAITNTPKLRGYSFVSMKEALTGLCRQEDESEDIPMYVLTNKSGTNGAGCILYKNLLQEIADSFQSDICIIPSSVHEVLLLPINVMGNCEELPKLIREINRTQIAPEEVLSDNAYIFNRELGTTTIQEDINHE